MDKNTRAFSGIALEESEAALQNLGSSLSILTSTMIYVHVRLPLIKNHPLLSFHSLIPSLFCARSPPALALPFPLSSLARSISISPSY